MIFSQTHEYGFRAMACLAIAYEDGPVPSAELAARTGIPPGYLSKVMRRMVVAKLIHSQRGQGGGFTLARPPSDIHFLDVLEALGFQLDTGRCAFGIGACSSAAPCPLHASWSGLRGQIRDWACGHTLDELASAEAVIPPRPDP